MTPTDTEASGTDITYTYDKDSNVTTMTDEAGNVFNYTSGGDYDSGCGCSSGNVIAVSAAD